MSSIFRHIAWKCRHFRINWTIMKKTNREELALEGRNWVYEIYHFTVGPIYGRVCWDA